MTWWESASDREIANWLGTGSDWRKDQPLRAAITQPVGTHRVRRNEAR